MRFAKEFGKNRQYIISTRKLELCEVSTNASSHETRPHCVFDTCVRPASQLCIVVCHANGQWRDWMGNRQQSASKLNWGRAWVGDVGDAACYIRRTADIITWCNSSVDKTARNQPVSSGHWLLHHWPHHPSFVSFQSLQLWWTYGSDPVMSSVPSLS